jgi:hypothetical protein
MRIFALCFLLISHGSSASFDWTDYSALLSKHVTNGEKEGIHSNLVDYQAFSQDPRFSDLIERLALFDSSTLASNEKIAFYLNTYNLLAIKLVAEHKPKKSIRDIGTWFSPVWQKPAAVVAGKMISLDTIEHNILRKMNEPRVHFALVCASISCPDLRTEAYNSKDLDNQLDQQAKIFLANKEKGLHIKGETVYISKIFDWFTEDFSKDNNAAGVIRFIAQYNIEAGRFSDYETLEYNWNLNQAQ